MPGTIGYTGIGTGSDVVTSTWTPDANVGPTFRYTASAGEAATLVSFYSDGLAGSPTAQVGVYVYDSGTGLPTTFVGLGVVTIGTTPGWYTTVVNIPLTAGVTYVAAAAYFISIGGYSVHFETIGGVISTGSVGTTLPQPSWITTGGPWGDAGSYFVTVTAAPAGVTGTIAATEAADVAALVGSFTAAGAFSGVVTVTEADDVAAIVGTFTAGPTTGTIAVTEANDVSAITGTVTNPPTTVRYPSTVSLRKILDQNGNVLLYFPISSWGLYIRPQSEITDLLEALATQTAFNGTTVWCGGGMALSGWPVYNDGAGNPFWTGLPWQSSLGTGWLTIDHIVNECERLGLCLSLSFDISDAGAQMDAATNAQMQASGVAIATRYAGHTTFVWHAMFDDPPSTTSTPASTRGQRVKALFAGINSVEGTARFRWMETARDDSAVEIGWITDTDLRPSINNIYSYSSNSVEAADAGMAENAIYAVGDCEPPYDGAPHYTGSAPQQLRERTAANFIRGLAMAQWGHEDWWRFGAQGGYTEGLTYDQVPTHIHTQEQRFLFNALQPYVGTVSWAPTTALLTTGLSSGDTKAAVGMSNSAGLIYFPSNRTVVVDTTQIAGTSPVRLRWFDPVLNTYTTIAANEAQTASRSVSYPANHSDGTSDYLLVIDLADTTTGVVAVTESADVAAIVGTVTAPPGTVTGTVAVTEATDLAVIVGTVTVGAVVGVIAAVESNDTAVIVGSLPDVPDVPSGQLIVELSVPPTLTVEVNVR